MGVPMTSMMRLWCLSLLVCSYAVAKGTGADDLKMDGYGGGGDAGAPGYGGDGKQPGYGGGGGGGDGGQDGYGEMMQDGYGGKESKEPQCPPGQTAVTPKGYR